jgi:hypothetical protein
MTNLGIHLCPKFAVIQPKSMFKKLLIYSILLFVGLALPCKLRSQISITQLGVPITQNFNTLEFTTSSSSMPSGWSFQEKGTSTLVDGFYGVNTGTTATGNSYSFGASANPERAFGGVNSSALDSVILGVTFTNNTGSTITSLNIQYVGEQWRQISTRTFADSILFGYSTDATSLNNGTWTGVSQLNFLSLHFGSVTGGMDGNAGANRQVISHTISGLNILPGATFMLRWIDRDVTGNDDGLAVDDFTMSACAGTPTASLSGSATICLASTATLTASYNGGAPWQFTWTDGTSPTTVTGITSSTFIWTVTPGSTRTYTANNFNGPCGVPSPSSASAIVDVFTATPTAVMSGTQTICTGGTVALSVALTGVHPFSLTYTDGTTPINFTGVTANPYILILTPSATTSFSLTAVNDNCQAGSPSGSAVITVDPANPPTATLSGSQSICPGGAATLSVALANGTSWNFQYTDGTNAVSVTGITASPATFQVSPSATSTYSLTSVSNQTCSGTPSGTAVVHVHAIPVATLSAANTICTPSSSVVSIGLTGTGPWSVNYTDGVTPVTVTGITASQYTFSVTPSATTTYSVTSVSDANCTSTAGSSDVVTVNVTPTATISGNQSICSGDAVSLSVTLTGVQPWDLTYSAGSTTVNQTGIVSNPYVINATPGASVTYTLISVSGLCSGTLVNATSVVTVNSPASAALSGTASVCSGNAAIISVDLLSSVTPYDITYTDGVTPVTVTGITSTQYTFSVSPTATVTYTLVSVTDAGGCTGVVSGSAVLTVFQTPTATVSGDQSICSGSSAMLTIALTGSTPYNVVYSNGVTNSTVNGITGSPYVLSITPAVSATYSLVSVTGSNCPGTVSGTAEVTVNPTPVPVIVNTGGTLSITGITGAATYQWQLNGTDISGATASTHVATSGGNYTVVVTQDGCTGTSSSLNVTVGRDADVIGQMFTVYPNPSKGLFRLQGDVQVHAVRVLDASGRVVYENRTDAVTVDYTIDLSAQPSGVYYLMLDTERGSGSKVIIRN